MARGLGYVLDMIWIMACRDHSPKSKLQAQLLFYNCMNSIVRHWAFFGKACCSDTPIGAPDFNPVVSLAFGNDNLHGFPMARELLEEKP